VSCLTEPQRVIIDYSVGGIVFEDQIITEENQLYNASAIHHVALLGEKFLENEGDNLSWWKKLDIHWPADGDYYSSWSGVYITAGTHWDVVGHEIGHAIYDRASQGQFGGGQHYIDRCYSSRLAFSEGWASFYSAATQIERNNPDPHFEFMVARRAPLEIEHIPEDVCEGDTNEWRVYAALWDLYDNYEGDDDEFAMPFIMQWNAFKGPNQMDGIEAFVTTNLFPLTETPEDQEEVLRVLEHNTITF